jgi:IMP dehydrogenase/GMP reductase
MRIETESKLDFKDVLFKPKRSTLTSRKEVDLNRDFKFPHSNRVWSGVPIVAANMDTVGTIEAGKVLSQNNMLTCLHKHYTEDEYIDLYNWAYANQGSTYASYWAYSMGISDEEFARLESVQKKTSGKITTICIDVANGYTERFINFVSKVRNRYPEAIIIAGNVVTAEITEQLILAGADIVKVGIGSGCFVAGTPILTNNGLKPIEKVEVGDKVMTHMGRERTVTNTFTHTDKNILINVNGIKATPNHEFYVVHKSDVGLIYNDSVHEHAKWVRADELTNSYYLLEAPGFGLVEITTLETEPNPSGIAYDLEVEEDHSYTIGENRTVVHNSVCTTRIQAGVGYPQLSAVIECADAAHGLNGRIMSDGGCTCPGDVAKAFGGGADFVMLGGMLAGHVENLKLDDQGNALFYGMSSDTAMDKYHGGVNEYRSSEGRTVSLDQRGNIKDTIQDILGGVRSTCTYIGASELRELSKCTTFIRVSQQYNPVYESKTV